MEILTLFLVALGLCFDSFAVSISCGVARTKIDFFPATRIAFVLAIFQAVMPLIGWVVGVRLAEMVKEADHWIAFGLLLILGLKMIVDSIRSSDKPTDFDPLNIRVMVMMALATSIDALIVGVSFGTLHYNIWLAMGIIGFTTFVVAMLGILFGKKTGNRFGKRMEIVGGLILAGIGLKILLQHLYFS